MFFGVVYVLIMVIVNVVPWHILRFRHCVQRYFNDRFENYLDYPGHYNCFQSVLILFKLNWSEKLNTNTSFQKQRHYFVLVPLIDFPFFQVGLLLKLSFQKKKIVSKHRVTTICFRCTMFSYPILHVNELRRVDQHEIFRSIDMNFRAFFFLFIKQHEFLTTSTMKMKKKEPTLLLNYPNDMTQV